MIKKRCYQFIFEINDNFMIYYDELMNELKDNF